MSRLILHRAIASPPARSVMMLADILSLDMEIKDVNLYKMEHMTPEFKKLNPMRTVPVLQDGDYTLCESHSILKYLLEKYGGEHRERLYPSDLRTRSIVDQCMFFNAGMFFVPIRSLAFLTFTGQLSGLTPEHQAEIEKLFGVVEDYLADRKYIATDRLTLADLSAGSTATAVQALHRTDPDKFPLCYDWIKRLEQEPFFEKVNAPGVAYFTKMVHNLWEKNKKSK
ncbi:glutathione S-transferase 1-like [Manduca sexta]|uniref:glutathione S-transferase 1-like n=1 Tax=Manduca sexta TaxID=7130 RepID=UPI00188E069F|nr:glutathione S-transferase 1-like [Manduca sexta]XP_037295537.1 glutathione S-transferase 1-like [Manduca sexta]XP_037295538.1 glutathione S-transferase 1-like [Manduca sexta]XP_037295539.1 glutathione S-transferase 1-like [Manduca sexta]XP_037295540.1 glutathione S-transferase 1-like [Manduca sexta]